jgi:hypothetical protein
MNPNKVKRLWREYNALRSQRVVTTGELQAFAQKLGRRRVARGKEPNWESSELPDLPPISRLELKYPEAEDLIDEYEGYEQ